ncbi:MAG: hypothetical protein J3Q66DRAFT_327297 [Benniella sp.]|nr:MAG: hypothetical protein J3Q66DRAFT_327297 [Benniella sp.]
MVKSLPSLLTILLPVVLSTAYSYPVHNIPEKRALNTVLECAAKYLGPIPKGSWPQPNCVPFVEDPQVQEWIKLVDLTKVPVHPLSNNGECPSPANITGDRCWWPCQKCEANDDIAHCPTPNTWGLTFDDGPSENSARLYDYLSSHNQKATFFVTGSHIIHHSAMLKRAYQDGHQIAIHSWSHRPMTSLTNQEIIADLKWAEKAIYETIGVTPLYWSPPFGDVDNRVRSIAKQLGYTILIWSGELQVGRDFLYNKPSPQQVVDTFKSWLNVVPGMTTGFIAPLELGSFPDLIDVTINSILPLAYSNKNLNIVPVAKCLDDATPYKEGAGTFLLDGPLPSSTTTVAVIPTITTMVATTTMAMTTVTTTASVPATTEAPASPSSEPNVTVIRNPQTAKDKLNSAPSTAPTTISSTLAIGSSLVIMFLVGAL